MAQLPFIDITWNQGPLPEQVRNTGLFDSHSDIIVTVGEDSSSYYASRQQRVILGLPQSVYSFISFRHCDDILEKNIGISKARRWGTVGMAVLSAIGMAGFSHAADTESPGESLFHGPAMGGWDTHNAQENSYGPFVWQSTQVAPNAGGNPHMTLGELESVLITSSTTPGSREDLNLTYYDNGWQNQIILDGTPPQRIGAGNSLKTDTDGNLYGAYTIFEQSGTGIGFIKRDIQGNWQNSPIYHSGGGNEGININYVDTIRTSDGRYVVIFKKQIATTEQLFYTWSDDGTEWSPTEAVFLDGSARFAKNARLDATQDGILKIVCEYDSESGNKDHVKAFTGIWNPDINNFDFEVENIEGYYTHEALRRGLAQAVNRDGSMDVALYFAQSGQPQLRHYQKTQDAGYEPSEDGEGWFFKVVDQDAINPGDFCDIETFQFGQTKITMISYVDRLDNVYGNLKVAYRIDDREWNIETVVENIMHNSDNTFATVANTSLEIDRFGSPYVACFNDSTTENGNMLVALGLSPNMRALRAVAPGPGPTNAPEVGLYSFSGILIETITAYGADGYGVNLAIGDVLGNGSQQLLTGAGHGSVYGPHVRGFDALGVPLPGLSFLAYGTNRWGVNVAVGDINMDGRDEIITGAGPGAVFGPHVRAFEYDGSGIQSLPGVNFFAYGTPKWGVNVAVGDIDGDLFKEIITGAGPGSVYGPHVRAFDYGGNEVVPISGVSFFAYGTQKHGVVVGAGDIDGDGIDEIVTGAGPSPSFGTHVRGWNYDGDLITPVSTINFFAFQNLRHGARVAADKYEIFVGPGPDQDAPAIAGIYSLQEGEIKLEKTIMFDDTSTAGSNIAVNMSETQ